MASKKIAIFGGSFNPPHIGHKDLVALVRDSFPCDEIWLMPSGDRKDKIMHVSRDHRLAMAKLFAQEIKSLTTTSSANVVVSTIELDEVEPSSTIVTLNNLKKLHPDCEFHFIITTETLPGIKVFWRDGEALFNQAHFIIVERTGSLKLNESEMPPFYSIVHSPKPLPLISSTDLRLVSTEEDLYKSSLQCIAAYIIENKLYNFSK